MEHVVLLLKTDNVRAHDASRGFYGRLILDGLKMPGEGSSEDDTVRAHHASTSHFT
jgi:hypothetical protein